MKFIFTVILLLVLSSSLIAAPVPTHLMKEPCPVGTWIKYGETYFIVAEIKTFKCGIKCYRLIDPNPSNGWSGWWVSKDDVMCTLDYPDSTWRQKWNVWHTPDDDRSLRNGR